MFSEPVKRRGVKRQDSGKKKQASSRKSPKKEYLSSPRSAPMAALALITPDTRGTKKQLVISSELESDICPPMLSFSDSEDTNGGDEPHSGDEIAFEGQHFHYLDSFVPTARSSFSLEPRKTGAVAQSFPRLVCGGSESSLSIAKSLREPILTPSSSSSSLDEMFKNDGNVDINPETIFSDEGFDGDWKVGGESFDIDAELASMESNI